MSDIDTPNNHDDEPLDAFLKRIIPGITDEQILLVVGRFAENAAAIGADAYEEGYSEGCERGQQDGYAHGWYCRGLEE